MEVMKEIGRIKGFESGLFKCCKCGKENHLFFNGGELDEITCCGIKYVTEHIQIDLVIYDKEVD